MSMFCYQCEQTAKGTGCTVHGRLRQGRRRPRRCRTCWSTRPRASRCTPTARAQLGATDREVDVFVIEALFTTVTNVDFDPERLQELICARPPRCATRPRRCTRTPARKAGKTPETLDGPGGLAARRATSTAWSRRARRSRSSSAQDSARRRRRRPAGAAHLRPQGRGGLCRPRPGPRPGRRRGLRRLPRGARLPRPSRTRPSTSCSAGR